jgi:long-chain acyl-CoA synthetase
LFLKIIKENAMSDKLTICSRIQDSIRKYPSEPALSFVGESPITYGELGVRIEKLAGLLHENGIGKGDKVAIIGENSPNWGIAYLAVLAKGGITIPVLPDFHPGEIAEIVKHSETKLVFASKKQAERLTPQIKDSGLPLISLDNLRTADTGRSADEAVPYSCMKDSDCLCEEDDLAAIIYTSGTTGSSKGVMLTHRNIAWTARQSKTIEPVEKGHRFLSILPMSHTYENTLGLIFPLSEGAVVYYLKKQTTPSVLLEAFAAVKPTHLLTVPMIIEKIFRRQVLPKFNKSVITRTLFKFKPTRIVLNRLAGKKLLKVFGGHVRFFGIGGAKLDPTIETYLQEARFPYAIGYGLTETSPLLAGSSAGKTLWQSTGTALQGVSLRIADPDPATGQGEIQAMGPNVMKGYYKNPEATAKVITPDGWFCTGDLGYIDAKGTLYIRGRIKNVIVGTNGENIYPEEIEAILNSITGVEESLVIQKQGRLVAMVNLNLQELENKLIRLNDRAVQVTHETTDELLAEMQAFVNSRVNRFSRLQLVLVHNEPFEKTPTNKIKRYLYGG